MYPAVNENSLISVNDKFDISMQAQAGSCYQLPSSNMSLMEKLNILAAAAKYDVACTSSGSERSSKGSGLGNAVSCGICHSFSADGRCISLLKILLTNKCIFDCKYCINRSSNDIKRAAFTPEEIAELTINFYRRNYIEGLFLSSAVYKKPDYTMELIIKTIALLRKKYNFKGYIHIKAIPGADKRLIDMAGLLVDRMSVNIELPTEQGLKALAPHKSKESILGSIKHIKSRIIESKHEVTIYKNAPSFVPAGQSTQVIVGATQDTDLKIITLSENLYNIYKLKRVFYSAFVRVNEDPYLPVQYTGPPLLREHRLYQADWLLRFYGFKADELLSEQRPNFNVLLDPKCDWAVRNLDFFPVEVNIADYYTLLRVPGIGKISAAKIIAARRTATLDFDDLKKLGVVLKRAQFFITCKGRLMYNFKMQEDFITSNLVHQKQISSTISSGEEVKFKQLSFFDDNKFNVLPGKDDKVLSLTGEL